MKQYLRAKIIKWVTKFGRYPIALRFGAKDGNVEKGLPYRVVMELANGYLDSQHVMIMDNYFTSVPLSA